MFGKRKLYKIIYQTFANYVTVITAKDASQALKKFRKNAKKEWFIVPDIISIQEIV